MQSGKISLLITYIYILHVYIFYQQYELNNVLFNDSSVNKGQELWY